MARLIEKLDNMVITATSPDGQIKAKFEGRKDLTLGFRPGAYEKYSEEILAHQLARLATLVWTGNQRGILQAMGEVDDTVYRTEPEHWDANRRRYNAELAEMVTEGESMQGIVKVKAKGLMEWKVRIKPGTIEEVEEPRFLQTVMSAYRSNDMDHKRKTILLKQKHFGLAIPASWKAKFPGYPG